MVKRQQGCIADGMFSVKETSEVDQMAASSGRKTSSSNKKTTRSNAKNSVRNRKTSAAQAARESALFHEIGLIVLFAVMVFLFCCNFGIVGSVGNAVSGVLFGLLGMSAYVAPAALFLAVAFWFANEGNPSAVRKLAAGIVLFVMLGIVCDLFAQGAGSMEEYNVKVLYEDCRDGKMGGGVLAGSISFLLQSYLETIGTVLVVILCTVVSLILLTEKSLLGTMKRGGSRMRELSREDAQRRREMAEARRQEQEENTERRREMAEIRRQEREENTQRRKESARLRRQAQEEQRARKAEERRLRAEEKENEKILRMEKKVSGVMLDTALSRPEDVINRRDDVHEIILAEETEELPVEKETAGRAEKPAAVENGGENGAIQGTKEAEEEFFPVLEDAQEDEEEFFDSWGRVASEGMPEFTVRVHKEGLNGEAFAAAMAMAPETHESRYAGNGPAREYEDEQQEYPESGNGQEASEEKFWPHEDCITEYEIKTDDIKDQASEANRFGGDISYGGGSSSGPESGRTSAVSEENGQRRMPSVPVRREEISGRLGSETGGENRIAPAGPRPAAFPAEQGGRVAPEINAPKKYMLPPVNLLQKGTGATGDSTRELQETALHLQQTLATFGVKVTITDISQGPSVTRYELQPEQGVKVSKIVGLTDDIKLNLAAMDIRIEAPIPGKAAIGIEVPNKENMTVALRDLLESREFRDFQSNIAFAVGKDIAGKVVVSDIAKMPHMLIAGATGSGKSVCINTLIMSILYKAHPDEVKLIMVDPKVVELSIYNGIPHLLIPVVTDPKKASAALHWGVTEMEDRYRKFAECNVRDLKGYNKKLEALWNKGEENVPRKLPQIVIIVDELADLMMVCPGEVEESICRLAQLARACGIHLIIATQRPSVDVITGLIKANMPSRVAFSVSSGVDSRTILDMVGAEKLLGKGDMLYYPQGYAKPARVQGAFVSDDEVSAVVDFLKNQALGNTYAEEVEEKIANMGSGSGGAEKSSGGSDVDELFERAGRLIIDKDKASIGMLQRALQIGFNRAARIMDQLCQYGVVGEEEGTKPRKILMSPEQFEQLLEEVA